MSYAKYVRKVYKTYLRERPQNVQDLLEKYGDSIITKIDICRTPLSRIAELATRIGSLGKLDELRQQGLYDKLFHLNMNVHLEDGTVIGLEKNQRPAIKIGGFPKSDDTACESVDGLYITLNDLIEKGEQKALKKGNKNFWRYTYKDNCQKFINDMITANYIHHLSKFIMQDIEEILKNETIKKLSKYFIDGATLVGAEI
ncbi:MAG: hypothetical protein V4589_05550 [Bacteroidota bacterium]